MSLYLFLSKQGRVHPLMRNMTGLGGPGSHNSYNTITNAEKHDLVWKKGFADVNFKDLKKKSS